MKKPSKKEELQLFAVNSFVYYMANRWSWSESLRIFGQDLGTHFYNKWAQAAEDSTPDYATLKLWYAMSNTYRPKLLNAAIAYYESTTTTE